MNDTPLLARELARPPKTVDPNHDIRTQRADRYPKQIWFFLASFVGLITLFHLGTLFVFWQRKRHVRLTISRISEGEQPPNNEEPRSTLNPKISLRRISLAIINSFRILLYRTTVSIGGGNVLNGAEIGVTAGYVITLFTWEFIDCVCPSL